MPSDHTRTAILEAAERLYADRGFADVTLRDIVAAADVNLAAVNYHFGSKDELIAELFVTRSLALNRERLSELRAAEERGGGRAEIAEVLRALVGPSLRGCLGPDRQRSAAARFMIRASIESVPPIRKIKNREIDHLRRFAAAMKRSLPGRDEVELYWGLHFALAMAHQTIRDSERLAKLSEGKCDLDDVEGVVERVVKVAVMGVMGVMRRGTRPRRSGHGERANPEPLTAKLYCGPPTLLYADRRTPHCRSRITNLKRILVATSPHFCCRSAVPPPRLSRSGCFAAICRRTRTGASCSWT